MLAVALLKVALLSTPSRFLPIHRHGPVKIVSLGPSNSLCQRPLKQTLLADFLQFREGMVQAVHMPLKKRCAMLTSSITNTKPPHFSLTLTFSSCLIMLPNMAPFELKLLGCTSQNPSKLLSGALRIYDCKDLQLPGNRQIALPSILMRYFCGKLTI